MDTLIIDNIFWYKYRMLGVMGASINQLKLYTLCCCE